MAKKTPLKTTQQWIAEAQRATIVDSVSLMAQAKTAATSTQDWLDCAAAYAAGIGVQDDNHLSLFNSPRRIKIDQCLQVAISRAEKSDCHNDYILCIKAYIKYEQKIDHYDLNNLIDKAEDTARNFSAWLSCLSLRIKYPCQYRRHDIKQSLTLANVYVRTTEDCIKLMVFCQRIQQQDFIPHLIWSAEAHAQTTSDWLLLANKVYSSIEYASNNHLYINAAKHLAHKTQDWIDLCLYYQQFYDTQQMHEYLQQAQSKATHYNDWKLCLNFCLTVDNQPDWLQQCMIKMECYLQRIEDWLDYVQMLQSAGMQPDVYRALIKAEAKTISADAYQQLANVWRSLDEPASFDRCIRVANTINRRSE